MATVIKIKGTKAPRWRVQWCTREGRKSISLPSVYTAAQAAQIAELVEILTACIRTGREPTPTVQEQIERLSPEMREKLSLAGLVPKTCSITLGELWQVFMADPGSTRKISTDKTYQTASRRLFGFFEPTRLISSITTSEGHAFRKWVAEHWASATVSGTIKNVRTVFNWAVKEGYLGKNPWNEVKRGSFTNPDNEVYVPLEDYDRLLAVCPNQDWRTLLALARIGGLRTPSEPLAITWQDVDWQNSRLRIRSSKTEHHEGQGERIIPLWPRLKEELDRSWDEANEESPYVIKRVRSTSANLRTQLDRLVFMAGLVGWPRPFNNLRSSADIDISREYPPHLASYWLGHSVRIAREHYLHPTESDYARAACDRLTSPKEHSEATETAPASKNGCTKLCSMSKNRVIQAK